MPYRKEDFAINEVYHVILRGIDGMTLFKDVDDYYRGIFSIYEFNDLRPVVIQQRRKERDAFKKVARRRASSTSGERFDVIQFVDNRDRLVDILAFCFMPNHIHLLVRQIKDEGVHKFMVKLGSGYGRYFNQKNGRRGYVFQGRFHSVHIKDDNQLVIAVNYIHANPISLVEPRFKDEGIKNHSIEEIMTYVARDYRWSSYMDYVGFKNLPSITHRDFVLEVMGNESGVMNTLKDWVFYKKELAMYEKVILFTKNKS